MGGFLIAKREKGVELEETERLLAESANVFYKNRLTLNKNLVTQDYVIYVFNKYKALRDNALLYDNGDFIIATGTMFYRGKMGDSALRQLYNDFSVETQNFFSDLLGNYCLIIFKAGRLYLVNNPAGVYRVYCDRSKKVFSTSFLAILKSLKKHTIGAQEFYEYIFDGAVYGGKTMVKEIEIIDANNILQLSSTLSTIPVSLSFLKRYDFKSFNKSVEECAGQLIDYYTIIKENYGDSVCSALTAGMDTRLMLACMRNVDIKPYLYIYGSENNTDVKIAKMIAKGEGLILDHEDISKFPRINKDEYSDFLEKQYYMNDGLGIEGIFDNGSDLSLRFKRIEKSQLQLNGGGYLLRLFYSLPDRATPIMSFLKAKHDGGDYSMCRHFNKGSYFLTVAEKIKDTLNINQDHIDRKQVETLFFDWRIRYWTAFNHMINEQLADALLPGIEPQFTNLTLNIPYKYMYLGIFQAAVIKLIQPDIARYPSQYGYNFYDYDKIPLRIRMREFMQFHTPIMLRSYIRKNYLNKIRKGSLPYYLTKEYLDVIFPSSELNISEFVDINKITDRRMLSRALSVELVLTSRF